LEGSVTIREFAPDDVDAILLIQSRCPEAAQWSRADYASVAGEGVRGWVWQQGPTVLGFLVARAAADELEILNLGVLPEARRQGVGHLLLEIALHWGRASGAARAFLEVRESNEPARLFYEAQGFFVAGRRPVYYAEPPEAALILSLPLA
jgi:ribosomal protein S18 acetylase RimI-like enzyme